MRKLLALIYIISYVFAAQFPTQAQKRINTDDELFTLAETGTPDQLKEAVAKGADFNVVRYGFSAEEAGINTEDWLFYNGETPLFRAAYYNHNSESIRFLISLGLNVNTYADHGGSGGFGGTPL